MAQAVQFNNEQEAKFWKQAFIILSAFILILMPALSHYYGMTGDEWLQLEYGQHIWDYFFHGDMQALDYTNRNAQYAQQELYGGLFDFSMNILHHWFPSVAILTLRHFFNSIFGAGFMVFTGLLGYRLSHKWSVGFIALLFIFLSPRIFGESMNNPKDIPFATGFAMGMYFLVAMLQDFPNKLWKNALGLAIGWGIAFGIRAAGGLLLGAYFVLFIGLFYFTHKAFSEMLMANSNKLLKKFIFFFVGAVLIGYIIGLLCWPWGLQSPISNPIESLKGMTNRVTNIRVLFEGSYRMAADMPWYYEFKWMIISNPLIIIFAFITFLALIMRAYKKYGTFAVALIVFSAFFPIVYMIYKHSTVYDTWRHVFFVYSYWVIGAAMGLDLISDFIKGNIKRWVPIGTAFIGLIPIMIWMVHSHPNQTVYFNELVGGAKGAYGYYDLDYYQNSGKQAADWIKEHGKHAPGKRIFVRSNMSSIGLYYEKDTNLIHGDYGRYTDRSHLDWDYYIAYPRYTPAEIMQNDKWILSNTVHRVEVDGVPLCVVVERKSLAGIDAFDAYQKKDYGTAVHKYAEYLKTDTTDEYVYANYAIALASTGQIDAGLAALQKAFELDPEQPQYLELQAEFYKAKGDMHGYQTMMQKTQALAAQQQEETE